MLPVQGNQSGVNLWQGLGGTWAWCPLPCAGTQPLQGPSPTVHLLAGLWSNAGVKLRLGGEGLVLPHLGLPPACAQLCRAAGRAYSLGRAEYGRLGLGTGAQERSSPTAIAELPSIASVACGASVGYAVSTDGECWGPPCPPAHPSSLHPDPLQPATWVRMGLGPGTGPQGQLGSGCSNISAGPWQQGWC